MVQMLPISKDNCLLQEAKWILDLDVGSWGGAGGGNSDQIVCVQQIPEIFGTFRTT